MKKIISLLLICFLVGCTSVDVDLVKMKENHAKLSSGLLHTRIDVDGERVLETVATFINRNEISVDNLKSNKKNYVKNQKGYQFAGNNWEEMKDVSKVDQILYDNLEMKSLMEFLIEHKKEVVIKKENDTIVLEWDKNEIEEVQFTNLARVLILKEPLDRSQKMMNVKLKVILNNQYIQSVELSCEGINNKIQIQSNLKQYNDDFSSKIQLRG